MGRRSPLRNPRTTRLMGTRKSPRNHGRRRVGITWKKQNHAQTKDAKDTIALSAKTIFTVHIAAENLLK